MCIIRNMIRHSTHFLPIYCRIIVVQRDCCLGKVKLHKAKYNTTINIIMQITYYQQFEDPFLPFGLALLKLIDLCLNK